MARINNISLPILPLTIEHLSQERKLFAYFLYDNRPSHRKIATFVDRHFEWFDALANSSDVYFIMPTKTRAGRKTLHEIVAEAESMQDAASYSLEIGSLFGIQPNQLPGIVLFTQMLLHSENKGVYLPIKAKFFENNEVYIESVLADLFSVVSSCNRRSSSAERILEELRKEIKRIRRSQQVNPLISHIKTSVLALVTIPTILVMNNHAYDKHDYGQSSSNFESSYDLAGLRAKLQRKLSDSDIRTLCFDVDVDYENLEGNSKESKLRSLLEHMNRREQIYELILHLSYLRPDIMLEDLI
jgi:uncharacterized protein YciI